VGRRGGEERGTTADPDPKVRGGGLREACGRGSREARGRAEGGRRRGSGEEWRPGVSRESRGGGGAAAMESRRGEALARGRAEPPTGKRKFR
jgi:hypothetical protein